MPLPHSDILRARHERARAVLDVRAVDAAVITAPANIRYLTNHVGSAGTLVVTHDAMHLLIDFRYEESARALQASPSACPGLRVWPVPNSYDEALVGCLADLGLQRVGFEAGHLTVSRYDWLLTTIRNRGLVISLVTTDRLVEELRIIKDSAELSALRESASRIADVAEAAFGAVRAGVTERQVAGTIEAALREAGYERIAFDTIVASGPNAALPHHRAADRRLAAGDLVVLDFGGVLDGYCCDLTRTVSVGPPSAEALRVHTAVREAQSAAIAAVRPGVLASDVDAAARRVLDSHGLGEAFGHGTGHGLGLDVHEEPRISRVRPDAAAVPLEAGMVFTIEPGAYLPGWGGVRIEDDVLVTEDGCEVLTSSPRNLLSLNG